jgi:hypothetical protein
MFKNTLKIRAYITASCLKFEPVMIGIGDDLK